MLNETGANHGVAAVVQDALTGEILWVGHLDTDAPMRIAQTGIIRTPGLAEGEPVAVRHLSNRGEGLVIHVEGPCTRRQLDSIMPEAENPFSQTELSDLSQTLTARLDSGKWAKPSLPNVPKVTAPGTASLEECLIAFMRLKNAGKPEAIAEQAAAILWALLEELRNVRVPLTMTLEAFRQRG